MSSDGGKGDGRRKGADDNAYRSGYDRIFGAKQEFDVAVAAPVDVCRKCNRIIGDAIPRCECKPVEQKKERKEKKDGGNLP